MTASDAARPLTGGALAALLSPATRLLGLGEPTHGVEAFLELRNELFHHLVEHEGYRSITLESGCLAALVADAYVTDGTATLDDAMSRGFSHGFGASPANRELLRWMRAYNEQRPPHERLHFYDARAVIDPGRLAATLDRKLTPRVPADYTYLSLDPATIDEIDAIVFVKEI